MVYALYIGKRLGKDLSLCWRKMATHCSILAWRIPSTEEPGGLQPMGVAEPGTAEQLSLTHLSFYNSDPLTVSVGVGTVVNRILNNFLHDIPFCYPAKMDSIQCILTENVCKMLLRI